MIPIFGIDIQSSYEIGNVTLYPSNKREEILKRAISDSSLEKKALEELSEAQDFAALSVKALDSVEAINLATTHVKNVLNILKFIFNGPSNMYRIGIGKNSKTMYDNEMLSILEGEFSIQRPFNYLPMPLN